MSLRKNSKQQEKDSNGDVVKKDRSNKRSNSENSESELSAVVFEAKYTTGDS